MNRLALFDCDGTMVDSAATICAAMERAFVAHALPAPDRAETRRIIGLSLVEAVAQLAPAHPDHVELADSYKRAFWALRQEGLVEEPLFDGVAHALAALEGDGWLLGVATGKSDRGLGLCLAGHGIRERFVTLQTADRHPSKPHPAMVLGAMAEAGAASETTVMIGDTSYDMQAAKAAGAAAIGVAWGCHPAEELLAAGADAIVIDPAELPALCAAYVRVTA
ncbi:HAD-IA family hydrolase [Sphingomonas jatrophae]|uniref:Phosphoglycolate phosphatase n=1 Tax=Sphingomonas jatrophae TaxID=1166337 RepID=A0A1I6JR57_9SPHN|nr:HAD-IA family hydrolase [Sphingomonas jatrophae]SFR81462.1 phosphoglycolate phosphatase [Sphingomonas jatrophae]